MPYNVWSKGSQWRKWDLHVHTPASFHWNGGKLLSEMSEDEKEATLQQLLTTIENTDVAVFCFTDYWTFDGYIQFLDFLRRKNIDCSRTVFPGMELRVQAPVDYRLNLQVILSNLLSVQQLIDFKSKLSIRIGAADRPVSDESIRSFAKTLDSSKAKVHGFGDPERLTDKELLQLGSITIEVSRESLEKAIQSLPPGAAYIVLPYNTSDGLEKLDWRKQPHADNYFMQTAHAIESRKRAVVELFLGIKTDKNREFIDNFQKTLNYTQKPVICGTDAHRFADYAKYPGNQITWIKADPTFEGLRQIFFEPRERARIQYLPPEDKTPYLVIDKVRFIDNTGAKLFSGDWIELNEDLNTVIGGKSSGKSLLLYHIVKTVAPELLQQRSGEIDIPEYHFGGPGQLDFEVKWKDGYTDKLSVAPEKKTREIEYIPQMYVNALAEKDGRASLYQLIESILQQNSDYKKFIQQMEQDISQVETGIEQDRANLLVLRDELRQLNSEVRTIGDSAINTEILRLTSMIDKLREESGFSPEERERYGTLQRRERIQRERLHRYKSLQESIASQTAVVSKLQNQVAQALEAPPPDPRLDRFGRRIMSSLASTAAASIAGGFSAISQSQKSLAEQVHSKSIKCENNALAFKDLLKPFEEKIRDQQRLTTLSDQLKQQQQLQSDLRAKNTQIKSVTDAGKRTRESLLTNYNRLLESYRQIVSLLQEPRYSRIGQDILLEASLRFDADNFWHSFSDLFDLRGNLASVFGPCFDENSDFLFLQDTHVKTIASIFDVLSKQPNPKLKFKGNAAANDAISQLFRNYFVVDYNIRYKDDDILNMSPGKRGLVLLQLILHISNATHPILIDQPEDNLDNRTIANELRDFLKEKKIARQILMVTHDANLVLLTDAENIIVSNQAGQQVERENSEFRFEYVTGALEHSFRAQETGASGVLFTQGIREHVCDVLEGGEEAFRKREQKYGFSSH